MTELPDLGPLVSSSALVAVLGHPDIIVLDATWARSYVGEGSPGSRFGVEHIPGARSFDFRRVVDPSSPLHDTVCSADDFETHVRHLGITDQHVICYSQGLFSGAARAWWLFRLFGHARVSVLDGGLAHWKQAGHPLSSGVAQPQLGRFVAKRQSGNFCDLDGIDAALLAGTQVVDARPTAVFAGDKDFFADTDSPAAGITGHVPGSRNLPTSAVVDGGLLRPVDELRSVVEQAGIDPQCPTITTCSLGVGASGAAFVLHLLGNEQVALFDGSWEAWAARSKQGR